MAELRRLVTHCNFGAYLEQVLRGHLVCGIRHENTQKRLLSEADLSLSRAIDIARSIEATEVQTSQLKATSSTPVLKITQTVRSRRAPDTRPDIPASEVHSLWGSAKDCYHRSSECFKCHKTGYVNRRKQLIKLSGIEDTEQQNYVFQLCSCSLCQCHSTLFF